MNDIKVFIDFDGTLCGESSWKNFCWNTTKVFTTGLHFRPPDIEWSILTGRPKIDRPLIKLACRKYNIYPKEIITSPTWFHIFKTERETIEWKESVIKKWLERLNIRTVIYVDDDLNLLSYFAYVSGLLVCTSRSLKSYLYNQGYYENL